MLESKFPLKNCSALINISNVLLARWLSSLDKYHCINHGFCFLCSDALTSGALLTQEELLLPEVAKFLEMVNNLPSESSFQMQTNYSRAHTPSYLLYEALTLSHYPPALITPGPDIRQLGTAPLPQSSLKLCRFAISKPVYPVSPFFPKETTRKALVHRHLPFSPPRSWHVPSSLQL